MGVSRGGPSTTLAPVQRSRRLGARILALATLAVALGPVAAVRAASPSEAEASQWVGRYCTPLGCRGEAGAGLANAAGFAGASGAVVLLARRRRA